MKATRSYHDVPGQKATEHRLTVTLEGARYEAQYIVTHECYSAIDPKDAAKIIDSYLWGQLMHTIEHNLRKNMTHA